MLPEMTPRRDRHLLKAVTISVFVNVGLALSAFYPGSPRKPSLLARIADVVAAPPGAISQLLFSPQQHTAHAFIVAAAESFVCSFVFYLLVAWIILRGATGIKHARATRKERAA
jgi:hypothetical protein